MIGDASTKPCGSGRSYLAKGASEPVPISLLEELEEVVVAWVWTRLGREPTFSEREKYVTVPTARAT
ncbi:hypothetical protein FOA52_009219 [Chlamydomonas sp. UWO 241]|nr:hypothetical protein FOA52_009219 [Chlamydomonas sp. UWO 241]